LLYFVGFFFMNSTSTLFKYPFLVYCLLFGATASQWARVSSFTRFLDHTQRRTTFGRTPLDKWSARRS
jgi:hypothetical protein